MKILQLNRKFCLTAYISLFISSIYIYVYIYNFFKRNITKKVLDTEQLKRNFYVNKYCKFYIRYHCGHFNTAKYKT